MPTHIDFAAEQLSALLDPKHVKQRAQSGRNLSYIEGWHAIAEANRIFGFDGWTRETVDIRCVAEKPRKIGRDDRAGWGVSYIAKVRVQALGVVREGTGTGHGIDADLGAAHESAIKEAETDAMKRALMTFGNPFGLALYDKAQAGVGENTPPYEPPGDPAPVGEVHPQTRYAPHVTEGLSQVPSKGRPAGWDDAVAIIKGAKDFAELQVAIKKPHYVNTTSAWSNYWLRKLADNVYLPKVAEFRGTEEAAHMQRQIHAKYPLDRIQEAAE
jgi:DNA recombination protein Rad52